MKKKVTTSTYGIIGTMLFGMFFGAGNLIFPIQMGQMAGTNYWPSLVGFLVTAIGLPLLGILAIGLTGSSGVLDLGSRVTPWFGRFFSIALYLTIGPLFAIPRTATVPFVVGFEPYLTGKSTAIWLFLFSFVFFSFVYYFSLNPAKIMDYIGRYLTPAFLGFLFILIIVAIMKPMGNFVEPIGDYVSHGFMTGFKEGYNTMDAIASLAFGIVVINGIKSLGISDKKEIATVTWKSGLLAVSMMGIIYGFIMYMGGSSVSTTGMFDNGGQIFAAITKHYFGQYGPILLAIIIVLACLKTSIGLVTSCSQFFHELFPKISYRTFVTLLSFVSFAIANVGLSNIIAFAVPVLMFLYPLAIVLIFLGLSSPLFGHKRRVYQYAILLTFLVSLLDGYHALIHNLPSLQVGILNQIGQFYADVLPLYGIGLGWLVPSIVGVVIGLVIPEKR